MLNPEEKCVSRRKWREKEIFNKPKPEFATNNKGNSKGYTSSRRIMITDGMSETQDVFLKEVSMWANRRSTDYIKLE